MTKTILTLDAHGHVVTLRDWDKSSDEQATIELRLDGFCLAVVTRERFGLLKSMAENLAYALKAPRRKKRTDHVSCRRRIRA